MAGRVDRFGRAEKGSQLQTQIYVNRRQEDLDKACLKALPSLATRRPRIRWASPLERDSFREYYDKSFLRAAGRGELTDLLKRFWPANGPHWDAFAIVETVEGSTGVLLAEGKNYPGEMRSTMGASAPSQRNESAALSGVPPFQATRQGLTS